MPNFRNKKGSNDSTQITRSKLFRHLSSLLPLLVRSHCPVEETHLLLQLWTVQVWIGQPNHDNCPGLYFGFHKLPNHPFDPHLPRPSLKLIPSDILPPTTAKSSAPPESLTEVAYSANTLSRSAVLLGSLKIFFLDSILLVFGQEWDSKSFLGFTYIN